MNDKLEQLYNLYKQNGIIQSTDFNKFASADENQRRKLYDLGRQKGLFKTTDFNTFNTAFEPVKKKGTTVSPSVQKQEPISSVTPPKGPQKPSVSSVSGKDEGLYKFPGNEKATYKKQGNEWYVDPSGSGKFTKLYKGDVEERVKLLESKAVPYSGKKEENGIFSGVPGKGETEYVLDTSGENPVWAERRLSRMPDGTVIKVINNQTGKSEDKYHTVPITDPTRVQYLNKYFKQNASTDRNEKIFTGLPNKEKNEYKIEDGVWLRRQPGQDDWTKIYDETAVTYLNKYFKQDIKVDAGASKYAKFTEDASQVELKNFDNRLNSIDKSLVGKEEEDVINNLKSKFPTFKFEEAGLMTDEITVVAPNGEIKTFPFDNFSDKADVAVANDMKAWMRQNSNLKGIDNIKESEIKLAEKEKQLKDAKLPAYNPQIKLGEGYGLGPEMNAQIAEKAPEKKVNLMVAEQEVRDARKEYASTVAGAFKDIRDRQVAASRSGSSLTEEQVAAELAQLPKDNTAIRRANEYTNDVKESVKMYADRVSELNKYASDIYAKVNSGEISKEQFELDYKPLIDKSREAIAQEGENINSQVKNMNYIDAAINESIGQQYVINEAKGSFGGGLAYKFVKGITYLPRLAGSIGAEIAGETAFTKEDQDRFARMIVGSGTTEEYMESKERNDFSKAMFSLAESMGALASGAALGGGPATYAAFYAQSYYEMKDELDQVKGISDTEKVLMSSIYGAVSSVLEKFGIDFAMQKTGFGKNITNSIVKSVLMDMPKNAPKEFIEASIRNNISSTLLKAGIRTVGAGIVEGATETAQALSQVGIQEVYDIAKGTEYFNNKSGWEILSDAAYEGYLGMLGGHVMGVVSNSKQVATEGIQKSMNKEQMEVLFNSAKMDGIPEALLTNLKSSIISGKISKQEAQEIYNSYGEVKSKIQSIPEEYSVESKSVALDLMLEKDRINKQIAGKDANLVKPQMDRIAEIDNQLKTIGENAVKESTKPVQEVTAEGGGIQREGTKERQPEVREGERPVGETAQPETNLGNRPVEGRGTQEARVTRDVVNRPAVLSEFGGKQLDTPLNGDVYVDGQQVVFEDRATGRVYELGNVDEVMDTQIAGLSVEQERVTITPEGKVSIDNSNWNIQSELPTQGIEYNPAGEVTRVSLKDDAGNTRMFEGQDAVDIAYQIELQKYQSPEQQQFINDLLEQDEEFQTATENIKPAEVTAVVQEEATPDIVQAEPTAVEEAVVEQPVEEKQKAPKTIDKAIDFLDDIEKKLDEFGKETLGVNIPVAVLKTALSIAKTSLKAGKQFAEAITDAINHIKSTDFYKNLKDTDKQQIESDVNDLFTGNKTFDDLTKKGTISRPASGTTVKDVFKKSKEELEAKYKKPSIFKRFMEGIKSFRKAMFDRQTDLKRGLRGIKNKEAKQAHAKLVDKAGASGFAGLRFKILDKKIYRGKFNRMLPKQDLEALDEIIYSRRMISINENRAKLREKAYDGLTEESKKDLDNIVKYKESKNTNELNKIKDRVGEKTYKDLLNRSEIYKNPYTGVNGFNETDAQMSLENLRAELGEKKFNDLNRRADIYFDAFSENLKILKDSGRINEETYNNLKDVEYSPIKTIKYIIGDNQNLADIDREASRIGITKEDIKSLTDKNENGIITDSRWLLMMNLNTVTNRAFENQMINEMVDAIEKATPKEKSTLSEYFILDNPVVGEFKDGRPKRKYDSEAMPDGYRKVHYFKNGVDNYIIAREDIARQILDVKETKVVPAIEQFNEDVPILGWLLKNIALTPSRMLRFFATGGNPFFILRNVPMDWGNAVFFTDVYSHKWYEYFKLISGVKAAVGFTKNFTKKMFNDLKRTILNGEIDKVYMEYAAHGGLMESMSQEGLRALKELKPKGRIASKIPNAKLRSAFEFTVNAPYRILSAYGTALSYLGETSEIAMRLAVYEKMKKNLIDDYKKENNGENPTGKDLDDIMWEASREARELIDFNQGGTWAKEMDVFMPYFNAGMQGLRKPLDYAEQKPAQFASSMFQLSVMGAILAGTSIATALAAFDDEDDEEERKKKVKFALDSISVHEKANYHIIFTGKKDKNGELQYIRIKKLPVASIITTAAENLMYSTQLGYDNKKVLGKALKASTPVWPTEIPGRNPMTAAIVAYYGYDLFTEEQVFRAPKNKKILPIAEGLEDDRVEAIYKSLAPSLGLSPARSKAFVEKIITNESTNPTINIIYAAANGIFDRSTPFGQNFTIMSDELLKHAERQSVRYTNKDIVRYSLQDEFEKKEMKRETEIYLKEQKVYNQIKKVYDEGGSLTVGELEDIVEKNFDKARQLTELKKYYAYARNMNIDKSMLDIIYEENPEVQSMRIYERYGNVIDKEEVKELGQIIGNTGKSISPKTWYYYEKEFKGKIQ